MKKLIILIACISTSIFMMAQENFQLSKCKTKLIGTSTLHDWTADVQKATGSATLDYSNNELKGITSLFINMDAATLKSSKGSTMDDNIRKTLNTKQYPSITFQLTRLISLTKRGTSYDIKVEGKLTISGTTKVVELTATGTASSGDIIFKGSKKLKMTDFKVEPPTMFLGTLKTADDVTIEFETTFSKGGLSNK